MKRFKTHSLLTLTVLFLLPGSAFAQDAVSEAETETFDPAVYQGSYEGRDVQMENGLLTYYREGMMNSIELGYIGEDRFEIVVPPGAVVQSRDGHAIPTFRFDRDDDGKVVSLSLIAPSGELMATHPKTKELRSVEEERAVN